MEKVIRTSSANKILLGVVAMVFSAFGGALLYLSMFELEGDEKGQAYFFIPTGLAFIVLAVYFIQYIRKWHMIISAELIKEVGVFKTNELAIDDVKGYTTDDKYLRIISATTGKSVIALSLQMGKDKELINWIESSFANVDLLERVQGQIAAMLDENLGATEEERAAKLQSASKVAKVINGVGIAVGVWAFIFPQPYEWVGIACTVVPIFALLTYHYFRGAIKFVGSTNSAYPSILAATLFPSAVLALRGMIDFEILDYTNIWTYIVPISVTMLAAIFANRKALLYEKITMIANLTLGIVMAGAFAFGSVIFVNCSYDNNIPDVYTAIVQSKHVSGGKNETYYLGLNAWGTYPAADHSVESDLYNRVEVGDEVNVYVLKGSLNIPWLAITD